MDTIVNKSTLTKTTLARSLFKNLGFKKHDAEEIVEEFFSMVINVLEKGEDIKLPGFGNFQLRDKQARPGLNPRTRVAVKIAARRTIVFYASFKLKYLIECKNKNRT